MGESYYYCILCAQLECISKLIQFEADEELFHKASIKLSRLNIFYDYNEKYPKNICKSCHDNLEKAFDFVIKVEKAHHILSDLYTNKCESLKEQDFDISEDEHENILNNENSGIVKDEQNSILENITQELSEDKHSDVLEDQQADVKKQEQNNILENIQSDISEDADSSRDKSDCGKGVDFEIYSQSSNDGSDISEGKTFESSHSNEIKNSNSCTDTKLNWNDYQWTCSICETQFSSHDELKLHSMECHRICNALKCFECNIRKLHLNRFIKHVQRHYIKLKFMCYKCNCNFSCTRALNSHKRLAHGPWTKFLCPGCNSDFESSQELEVHTKAFYRGKQFIHLPVELAAYDNGLTCEICKKSFNNNQLLHSHLFVHTVRKKEHVCDKCGKSFINKNHLKCHTVSHKDERIHECSKCKSKFKTIHQLKTHKAIHTGVKPYKCDQCGKEFRLKRYLQSHIIIHTNSLPYDCKYCDKKFRFKSLREQHLRQHTGFKPYSCEICNRDFTNWSNYNKHMKRLHNLNMAKKKITPDGVYPIDPSTGKIIKFDVDETLESKNQNGKGRTKMLSSHKKTTSQ